MNVSRHERRILLMLAQGGLIQIERDARREIESVAFLSREGWTLSGASIETWKRLRARGLIRTRSPGIYVISRAGLLALQS